MNSDENGKYKNQTQVYYMWAEKEYDDRNIYFDPIYVFLYPEYNATKQSSTEYIRMTYQNLVDYILEPSMEKCRDVISVNNYKTYLQCLSYQADNDKGEDTMAISKEERKILNDFIERNRDLLCAVINELPDVDKSAKNIVTNGIKNSKLYEFNGSFYGVGPLVLAVVKKWVEDNPGCNFAAVQAAFPDSLMSKTYGVVKPKKIIPAGHMKPPKRYFDTIIDLDDVQILVCNQWTKEKMPEFINNASKLGYTITPA